MLLATGSRMVNVVPASRTLCTDSENFTTHPRASADPADLGAQVTGSDAIGRSVSATGTAPLSYKWKKGGVYTGKITPTLSFTSVTLADAGDYWVEAYDPWTGCTFYGDYYIEVSTPVVLGPDQSLTVCAGAAPVDLYDFFTFTNANSVGWSLNGSAISWNTAQNATAGCL